MPKKAKRAKQVRTGARLASFRRGDISEGHGINMLQHICAVAPVPRPEDCGLFDTVATLLRSNNGKLFAEDSFLVQLKSNSEKKIKLASQLLEQFQAQDLAFILAKSDPVTNTIALYTTSHVTAHSKVGSVDCVELVFSSGEIGLNESTMVAPLGDPIVQFSVAEIVKPDFRERIYHVLKCWLELDRQNRRFRSLNIQSQFSWKTNEAPVIIGKRVTTQTANAAVELVDAEILFLKLASYAAAMDQAALTTISSAIVWMKTIGVWSDLLEQALFMLAVEHERKNILQILEEFPEAEVGSVIKQVKVEKEGEYLVSVFSAHRQNPFGMKTYEGTPSSLEALEGIHISINSQDENEFQVGLGPKWFAKRKRIFLKTVKNVFLSRADPSSQSGTVPSKFQD